MSVHRWARNANRVRDVMSTPLVQVTMDETLEDIAELFRKRRIHHAVIVEKGKIRGVISESDILRTLSPFIGKPLMERSQDLNTLHQRAHRFMTRHPYVIPFDAPVTEAARKMVREHVSCLPVVDGEGELIGIVTSTDLMRWMAAA